MGEVEGKNVFEEHVGKIVGVKSDSVDRKQVLAKKVMIVMER